MTEPTASLFVGVNVGYSGDVAVTDAREAHRIVSEKLSLIKRSGGDRNHYDLAPALMVYRKEWGCPDAGEPAAAVTTPNDVATAIKTGEALRAALNQNTVSFTNIPGGHGEKTVGFIAETKGDLQAWGKAWQDAAEAYFQQHKFYVTCGIYARADGAIVLQSEANPLYKDREDPARWKEAAAAIAKAAASSLNTTLDLNFRERDFTYLRAPDRKNSRGE